MSSTFVSENEYQNDNQSSLQHNVKSVKEHAKKLNRLSIEMMSQPVIGNAAKVNAAQQIRSSANKQPEKSAAKSLEIENFDFSDVKE